MLRPLLWGSRGGRGGCGFARAHGAFLAGGRWVGRVGSALRTARRPARRKPCFEN